ncbi:MAG: NAD(P)/FAD-dependent oxidoreductase [Micropepsaceae bacterium]
MPSRLFDDSQYDWTKPVTSHWEASRPVSAAVDAPPLLGDETAEVAIIGGGYCGLSAAHHLAQRGIGARVLEAGHIGWGASGRAGGFCCVGASFLGPGDLRKLYGEDETVAFYRVLADAVRAAEQVIAEEAIDVERQGDGVWTFAHKKRRVGELADHVTVAKRAGFEAELVSAEAFAERAFACAEQYGALHEKIGFGLNPLAYTQGLARAAQRRGAQLHTRSRVETWERAPGSHRLITATGSLRARRVIVTGNGYLPEDLVPELYGRTLPIISNIVTTRPLTEGELTAQSWRTRSPASNTRAHLSYLRLLPDNRLLFGGRGDTTGRPADGAAMRALLEQRLGKLFPAWRDVEIAHSWRGFIAATARLTPALGELPDDASISYAFGCHGNGIAFMTWAGRTLAERIAGEAHELPAAIRELPPRFPLPATRVWQLRAMIAAAYVQDAVF